MQSETQVSLFPFANNPSANGVVVRLHPFQITDRLGLDDDFVETYRVGRGLDASERFVKPFADRAEHRMIVRVNVVTEGPMFPQSRGTVFEHITPAGKCFLI